MDKIFKYIIASLVMCALVGIFVAISVPRPRLTFNDKKRLSQIVAECNEYLPREIGTLGYWDSMSFEDETITYAIRVKGDDKIMQLYSDNYEDFKDMLKFSFLEISEQGNLRNAFAHDLEAKGLNICFKISTEGNKKTNSWTITGKELSAFVDSCKLSPTTALKRVIDMQIKLVNLELPASATPNTTSVAINSAVGDVKEKSCLLNAIKYEGNNLIFEYQLDEESMKNIDCIKTLEDNADYMDAFVQELAQNKDLQEMIGILAISQSNLVLAYREKASVKQFSIKIPYFILRNHCKVPKCLLPTN